jgi:nucleoside-diphosphate-sugar epimerase
MQAAGKTVCVTGATGYLAGHVIVQLLEKGHVVHGTMRNLKDESRVAHLTEAAKKLGAAERLKFFSADLKEAHSFDAAVQGCDAVVHIANVVQLAAKDPVKEIIEPSVNGLRTVLESIEKEPRVTTLVLTSSYAAIEVGVPREPRGPLTEVDSNLAASPMWKPYSFSKVETERLAVEWAKKNPRVRYASIHPPMILGPQLNGDSVQSSSEAIMLIMTGQYPLLPPLWFPMVDVRDVAAAHVLAVDNDKAQGRYLTCNGHHWLIELAQMARERFPERPIPKHTLPVWLFKIVGRFDSRLDKGLLQENTVEGLHVDASKISSLGFKYQYDIKTSLQDHCQSLVDHGLVDKKKS